MLRLGVQWTASSISADLRVGNTVNLVAVATVSDVTCQVIELLISRVVFFYI